jgi:hypothetical protein
MLVGFRVLLATAAAVAASISAPTADARPFTNGSRTTADSAIRMAAYYPWFPEGWRTTEVDPFTHFTPSLGFYDAGNPAVIRRHIQAMLWGRIRAATYSWWGQGSATDTRFATHLAVASPFRFRWVIYHELEGYEDPSVEQIRSDLTYIRDRYSRSPGYLRLDGRFVVFVYGDGDDGTSCDAADRWVEASEGIGAYVVLKAFKGFRLCASQPQGWHAYLAEHAQYDLSPYAFSISPGFFFARETAPRLARSLPRWRRSIRRMVTSRAQFHLVISFNEWGEGTSIESAREWASRSGYGLYLDALHAIR